MRQLVPFPPKRRQTIYPPIETDNANRTGFKYHLALMPIYHAFKVVLEEFVCASDVCEGVTVPNDL